MNFFQKVSFLDKITLKNFSQNSINILFLFLIEDNHCPEKKYFFISRGPLGKGKELGNYTPRTLIYVLISVRFGSLIWVWESDLGKESDLDSEIGL